MSVGYYIRKRKVIAKPEIGEIPDWRKMIDSIIRTGVTKAHLAAQLGISREWLYNGIYQGKSQPSYPAGLMLIAISKQLEET